MCYIGAVNGRTLGFAVLLASALWPVVCAGQAAGQAAPGAKTSTASAAAPSSSTPSEAGAGAASSSSTEGDSGPCPATATPHITIATPAPAAAAWQWQDRIRWAAEIVLAILAYVGIMLAVAALRKIERQTRYTEAAAEAAA